jgi:hypothetical protein
MDRERIEGQVVTVLNDHELVINRGEDDGVLVGMRFVVLLKGPELKDPETGEVLDAIDLPKAIVKVVRASPHIAVARTFRTEIIRTGIASLMAGEQRARETLSSNATLESEISQESWIIERGDRVLQTAGDEYLPQDEA